MSDWKTTYHRIIRNAVEAIRETQVSTDRRLALWYLPASDTEYARLYVRYFDVGRLDNDGRADLELVAQEPVPTGLTPDELFQWIDSKTGWLPMLPTKLP
jgi:hypothetical protein